MHCFRWVAGTLLVLAATASCREAPLRSRRPDAPGTVFARADVVRGSELYARHCAVCHGRSGAGDGQAADVLSPLPRDFTSGRFRLVSTRNGVPSDEDLMRVLERGMPGSAMPSWSWMRDEDKGVLVEYVRHLAVEGLAVEIDALALADGEGEDWQASHALAVERMTPSAPVRILSQPREPDLALGERLYTQNCAACHGEDGKGRGEEPRADEDGNLTWARDFTAGILKGNATYEDLAHRVLAGMPGSAMPAIALDYDETAAVVAYVQSLIPPGGETRLVRERKRIPASFVSGSLPTDGGDPRWGAAREVAVGLAPLWWRSEAVFEVTVAALHDRTSIAFRLRWRDVSQEDGAIGEFPFSDGAAILFSVERDPPLFGMGSRSHPLNMWHWTASPWEEMAGALDIQPIPHALEDPVYDDVRADAPLYRLTRKWQTTADETESLTAAGVGNVKDLESGTLEIFANPTWKDGAWHVVFARSLAPRVEHEIAFTRGDRLQVCFAVWNGAAGDHRGQKSISIWQELVIER